MRPKIKAAMNALDVVYADIEETAKSILYPYTKEINELLDQANKIKDMTDSQMRNLAVLLSTKSFSLAEHKEFLTSKSRCAEALRKETYAIKYNQTEGTGGVRENTALAETNAEIVTEILMDLVASLLKTKLDGVYRLVDTLKTNLFSRMQEAKLTVSASNVRAAYED